MFILCNEVQTSLYSVGAGCQILLRRLGLNMDCKMVVFAQMRLVTSALWTEKKFHIKRNKLRWLGHQFQIPPGQLPGQVFRKCPKLEGLCLLTGQGMPRYSPGRAGGVV